MKKRDFDWCFEHEIFFREWWIYINEIIPDSNLWLDDVLFFDCWKMAKQYAYKIANSVDPQSRYSYTFRKIVYNTPVYKSHILYFLHTMLMSIKNENLEKMVSSFKTTLYKNLYSLELDKNSSNIKSAEVQLHYCLYVRGNENNYDYSLPDGGIKDETITQTKTKTGTDETITDETITITKTKTKTITETEENSVDVILQNYNALNDELFICAMQKAIEIGWIEKIEDSRYKWIGPTRIGTKKIKGHYNAALAYFIAKALKIKMELKPDKTPTEDSYVDINKKFPENYDIKEVFGLDIQSDQLVNALEAKNIQKWREVIDKFFDEELVRRDL